jgi:hypothetical protein
VVACVGCEMKCPLQPTTLPLQVRFARESIRRVTLDSIAGLMQSRHRQERENVKALTFGVENDHVSGFGWKRDEIPVRHPIFIPVRHLQYEWAITFDCFFYLGACHNKRSSQAFTFTSTLRRKIEDGWRRSEVPCPFHHPRNSRVFLAVTRPATV